MYMVLKFYCKLFMKENLCIFKNVVKVMWLIGCFIFDKLVFLWFNYLNICKIF